MKPKPNKTQERLYRYGLDKKAKIEQELIEKEEQEKEDAYNMAQTITDKYLEK